VCQEQPIRVLALHVETYQVLAAGRVPDLTFKEFELLKFLMQRRERVFTRTELLPEVWGYNFYGGTRRSTCTCVASGPGEAGITPIEVDGVCCRDAKV
jgi:DNA-binding response OmpR family regulator